MMPETILIIGETQTTSSDYLAKLAGLEWPEYLARVELHDLIPHRTDWWPKEEARQNAGVLWPSLLGRRTILLGQRVATAFSVSWPVLTWASLDDRGTRIAIVPSAWNTWWTDAANRSHARRFLRATFGTTEDE